MSNQPSARRPQTRSPSPAALAALRTAAVTRPLPAIDPRIAAVIATVQRRAAYQF